MGHALVLFFCFFFYIIKLIYSLSSNISFTFHYLFQFQSFTQSHKIHSYKKKKKPIEEKEKNITNALFCNISCKSNSHANFVFSHNYKDEH